MAQHPDASSSVHGDPFDVLARMIPRHVWLSLGIVIVTVMAGLLLFDPQRPPSAEAGGETETLEGRVKQVLAEERSQAEEGGETGYIQTLLVEITRGAAAASRSRSATASRRYCLTENRARPGDRVLIDRTRDPDGDEIYTVNDFIRWPALLTLALVFGVATVLVGGWVGLRALVSMGFSVLIIAFFIVPGILAGHDPLVICILGTAALMTATLYLTYGWTWKTHAALIALGISLLITSLLSAFFVSWARLTGYGSESAMFLRLSAGIQIDMQGVLLGSIVLGAPGCAGRCNHQPGVGGLPAQARRARPGLARPVPPQYGRGARPHRGGRQHAAVGLRRCFADSPAAGGGPGRATGSHDQSSVYR